MADIRINDEYYATIDKFIRNLRKNWNLSPKQEKRLRYHAGLIGTTQHYIQKEWNDQKKQVEPVEVPFVVDDGWVVDILKSGKLIIRFDGGFSTGYYGRPGRDGVNPRIYLSAKKEDLVVDV